MKILVNGKDAECAAATLAELWEAERQARAIASERGVAIALNGSLVKRERWRETAIRPGDRVEIVRAFAGG